MLSAKTCVASMVVGAMSAEAFLAPAMPARWGPAPRPARPPGNRRRRPRLPRRPPPCAEPGMRAVSAHRSQQPAPHAPFPARIPARVARARAPPRVHRVGRRCSGGPARPAPTSRAAPRRAGAQHGPQGQCEDCPRVQGYAGIRGVACARASVCTHAGGCRRRHRTCDAGLSIPRDHCCHTPRPTPVPSSSVDAVAAACASPAGPPRPYRARIAGCQPWRPRAATSRRRRASRACA